MTIHRFGSTKAACFAALVVLAGCGSAGEGAKSADTGSHPLVGRQGPAFSRKAVGGDDVLSTQSLDGKVAIVDFWATWCEPCKKSFPKLEALRVKYGASGLAIVAVSEDDEADAIPAFAKGLGAHFPLAWDEGKGIAGKWQPPTMPTTFVLDRKGIVRFVHVGFRDGEEAEIEREIKGLL